MPSANSSWACTIVTSVVARRRRRRRRPRPPTRWSRLQSRRAVGGQCCGEQLDQAGDGDRHADLGHVQQPRLDTAAEDERQDARHDEPEPEEQDPPRRGPARDQRSARGRAPAISGPYAQPRTSHGTPLNVLLMPPIRALSRVLRLGEPARQRAGRQGDLAVDQVHGGDAEHRPDQAHPARFAPDERRPVQPQLATPVLPERPLAVSGGRSSMRRYHQYRAAIGTIATATSFASSARTKKTLSPISGPGRPGPVVAMDAQEAADGEDGHHRVGALGDVHDRRDVGRDGGEDDRAGQCRPPGGRGSCGARRTPPRWRQRAEGCSSGGSPRCRAPHRCHSRANETVENGRKYGSLLPTTSKAPVNASPTSPNVHGRARM